MLEPTVNRAFKAEGTVDGAGEIHIHIINGKEHVAAVEITDEVPAEYAIVRAAGGGETTAADARDTAGVLVSYAQVGVVDLALRRQPSCPKQGSHRPSPSFPGATTHRRATRRGQRLQHKKPRRFPLPPSFRYP
jgi:hypothetical protein